MYQAREVIKTLNELKVAQCPSHYILLSIEDKNPLVSYNVSHLFFLDLHWRYPPILMLAFPDHVKRMHQDNDEGFIDEYNVSLS